MFQVPLVASIIKVHTTHLGIFCFAKILLNPLSNLEDILESGEDEVLDLPIPSSKALVTPSNVRWNSTNDAVKRVQELRNNDRLAFGSILTDANLPKLSDYHNEFIDQ
ncbi:unnamed protein product [Lepeophtheirus salmonis]|uniref:(salmon louse) hypothetical protein n=1 Tax=Lepeophtheirus salmonis TaxID=72036 RepID=A0A7R8H7I3_LEPSM|nr:unnamed protein product [Lepeophtheirus salmonis]CAF2910418.1 unnamed protein product [Lepeophtheirus salmonis]